MADYNSAYTGAEIDAAIAKANTALQEHQDISGKVDKVSGKGLSTNDYTDEEKTKLAGIDMSTKVDDVLYDDGLEISDDNGNIVLLIDNEGNLKTKNFDSKDIPNIEANPNSIATNQLNKLKINNNVYSLGNLPSPMADMIYELHRRAAANTTFPTFEIKKNVLIIGDSTIAGSQVGTKISNLLNVTGTLSDISQGSDTIQGQKAKYDNLTSEVKSAIDYAIVQIGLNDVGGNTVDAWKEKYQTLITDIRTNSPNAYIVISCMLPCRTRWEMLFPGSGEEKHQRWLGDNQSIIDNEYNADAVAYIHMYSMAYDNFTLRPEYDTGDKIHENLAGQKVIALSWLSAMFNNTKL